MAATTAVAIAVGLLAPQWTSDGNESPPRRNTARALDEDAAQAQARSTKKRVEVTALRTESTTTYALPDGSFDLVSYAGPVRAKVNGTWQPIDTTLEHTARGWRPKASPARVFFTDGSRSSAHASPAVARATGGITTAVHRGGSTTTINAQTAADPADMNELVTLVDGGHEITVSWPGPVPEPVVHGDQALYRSILPETDLLLTARDSGFSHVLIVHTKEAAQAPELKGITYGLSSPGLTFHIDKVTKTVTARDEDGKEVAVSPTPYMWDSAGTPDVTQGEDPQPAPPSDDPQPSTTPAPGEGDSGEDGDSENPDAPSDSDDTDAPSADPVADFSVRSSSSNGRTTAVRAAAFTPASLSDDDVLALQGIGGPVPGAHAAVADAELDGEGSGSSVLTVVPDSHLVNGDDTEWPLFVDPSFSLSSTNWTTAYNRYPSSSFYDGANYNSGTTEARVGFESDTWGTARSFFRLPLNNIKGAAVSSASIKLLETYAWSCDGRLVELWRTGSVSSKTTWSNQPSWIKQIGSKDVAHGYNSSCPDDYVTFDAKSVAQDAANGGWTSLTIGLRADNESSAYTWKKFKAEGNSRPKITVNYNRKPATPSSLKQIPGDTCDRSSPYIRVGKRDVTLSAKSSDPDDNLNHLRFEMWRTGYQDTTTVTKKQATNSDGIASADFPLSGLTNGYTYSWQVQAVDDSGAVSSWAPLNKTDADPTCRFTFDSTKPNSPKVSSTDFPQENDNGDAWSDLNPGDTGTFTFAPDGNTDVTGFGWAVNSSSCSTPVPVAAGASATVSVKPQYAGPNVLYVCAKDSAGNLSEPTDYVFYVSPRKEADGPGDVTGDAVPDLYAIGTDGNLRLYPSNSAGDIHRSLLGAHEDGTLLGSDPDGDGEILLPGYWKSPSGDPALIAHGGDIMPGDGLGDFFARMPDDKLYAYRGDGYGSTDITQRTLVLLPESSPSPATFDQMIVGDYNLDKRPDLFVTTKTGGMWAFTGYTGVAFTSATQIASTAWLDRDLVTVGDIDLDGAPDLLFRSESDNLRIRYGVKATTGGATIESLTTSAGSRDGTDATYASGWNTTDFPTRFLRGTPDVNKDGIPDIWTMTADGSIAFYKGGKTTLGTATTVISAGSEWDQTKLSFG
ncbi:FG-GAP-like repeat-containing protein [Streptomyces sp. NPDC002640]